MVSIRNRKKQSTLVNQLERSSVEASKVPRISHLIQRSSDRPDRTVWTNVGSSYGERVANRPEAQV